MSELRPCIVTTVNCTKQSVNELQRCHNKEFHVEKHNALFHCWSHRFWTIGESALVGGFSAGQMSVTTAIVEYEDGTIHEHYPTEIQFVDGKIKEYAFPEHESED